MSSNNLKFYTIDLEYFMKNTSSTPLDTLNSNNDQSSSNKDKSTVSFTISKKSNSLNTIHSFQPGKENKSSNHLMISNDRNYQTQNGDIKVNESKEKIDEQMILKGLEHFIKQHFVSRADLNRSDIQKEASPYGDDSWNIEQLIRHRVTKQYTEMLNDKYKLTNNSGTSNKIPFSFYFDLSASMFNYTSLLIKMIDRLLSNKVTAIYGYNQYIHRVLNESTGYKNIEELTKSIVNHSGSISDKILDKYLIEHEAEKVVVFSDYDPFDSVINLSKKAIVYWFCFEERGYSTNNNIDLFEGFLYHTTSFEDFRKHINKIDDRNYEIRQRILQKTIDSGGKIK